MLRVFLLFLPLVLLMLTNCSGEQKAQNPLLEDRFEALAVGYAPDKRTDRVEITRAGDTLRGYTTRGEVMDSLQVVVAQFPYLINDVRLLPDTVVGAQRCGIINVAVANLRSNPGHSQELATQALLGTPIQILDKRNGWYLVRTPDRYIAWLEPGAFVAMTSEEAREWLGDDIRLFVGSAGKLRSEPGAGRILSTLVPGGIVRYLPETTADGYHRVQLPDGVAGWVPAKAIMRAPEWWEPEAYSSDLLLNVARSLAGRPYLWGGTSPNGMDCSGFTKMSYYLNGFVVPRDASQQVRAGEDVQITDNFEFLLPGDQLFFGSYREDGSEKITHTGFYLGDGRFLHAGADNGRIMENSLLPGEEDFAAHRLNSLLRARRLRAGNEGVVPISEAFGELLR